MKIPIKELFPIILAGLGIIFAAFVYFTGLSGAGDGIFADAGILMEKATEVDMTNDILNECMEHNVEIPVIKYVGGARTVGEAVNFKELFQFTYSNGLAVMGTDSRYVTMYLSDIRDTSENSVCEKLSSADIEAMEEIPSAFVLDSEQGILYFHKSGSFKVILKVYYDANAYMEYEFLIPVEVG